MLLVVHSGASTRNMNAQLYDLTAIRYTVSGAAFLLRVNPNTLRRWAHGYTTVTDYGKIIHKKGLLKSESDDDSLFTFYDLIELRVARDLLRHKLKEVPNKVPSREITKLSDLVQISENLAAEIGEYPLARSNFRTVGRQLITQSSEASLLFNPLMLQSLLDFADEMVDDIRFDESTGLANLWYPDTDNRQVVINPRVKFGKPVVLSGITTNSIAERYKLEDKDVEETADFFDIPESEVRAAVEFENKWTA